MTDVEIALARPNDAPRLASMSRRLVEAGLEACWTAGRIERHFRHADSVVLVARAAGGVAGGAVMQYGDDAAHLNLLAVEPAWRRRGLGRRLLTWLEDTARGAGTFTIRLELRASNEAGRAFYAALGYRETGTVRGYYQGVEDAMRMARDLAVSAAPAAR